ncbi:hypothetical protein PtB15_13B48 [Puccinia triticina]|nr:hypothetical protein PtB15_13B48 [Puccinia triticina]
MNTTSSSAIMPTGPPKFHTKVEKVLYICEVLREQNLDPKKFITTFLTLNNTDLATKHQHWGSEGIKGTLDVIRAIGVLVCSQGGTEDWKDFIQTQAQVCLNAEGISSGKYRRGPYFNAKNITHNFFSHNEKLSRDLAVCTLEMPFLYGLLKSRLQVRSTNTAAKEEFSESDSEASDTELGSELVLKRPRKPTSAERRAARIHTPPPISS